MNRHLDEIRQTMDANIDDAFETIEEAKARAAEVFMCCIAAVGVQDGKYYLRPAESKDSNIVAYVVITMQMKSWNQ